VIGSEEINHLRGNDYLRSAEVFYLVLAQGRSVFWNVFLSCVGIDVPIGQDQ
jgi:hypothetical protein